MMIEEQENRPIIALDVLVENLGRVNYGAKLNSPSQSEGIRNGAMQGTHFHLGYRHYSLTFEQTQLDKIDYSADKDPSQPSFYQFELDLAEEADAYIDCSSYGKEIVIVSGLNLGRYWNHGPILSLYCPKDVLEKGRNEVVIFETEGMSINTLIFSDQPTKKDLS